MTTREFLNAVIDMTDTACATDSEMSFGNQSVVDLSAKARDLLTAMDEKNAKAKAKPRKADPAVTARKDAVAEFVVTHEGEFTADEIAALIGETVPMSPAAVASAMRIHVAGGKVTKGSRKIDSKHSKVIYIIGE